jgi:hypothetical protein
MPRQKPNDGLTNVERYRQRHPERQAQSTKRYRQSHPEQVRASRARWKKENPERCAEIQQKAALNCTLGKGAFDHFEAQRKRQKGKCSICNKPLIVRGHSDHSHITGKWRGVLCGTCNRGLGYLQDSTKNLQRAIQYLRKWRA